MFRIICETILIYAACGFFGYAEDTLLVRELYCFIMTVIILQFLSQIGLFLWQCKRRYNTYSICQQVSLDLNEITRCKCDREKFFRLCRLFLNCFVIYICAVTYIKIFFDVITYFFFEFESINLWLCIPFVVFFYFYDYLRKWNVFSKSCLEDFENELDILYDDGSLDVAQSKNCL